MAGEYADQFGNEADDEIPNLEVQCTVCGGANYFMVGGFYYCSTCQTQSQESRLFLEEDVADYGSQHRSRVTVVGDNEKTSAETEALKSQLPGLVLTSWEVHNLALKVIADRLIELGYPPQVKAEILKLWCTYLKRRKVVLVSKSSDELSTFTRDEPILNIRAILGLNEQKRKRLKKKNKKEQQKGSATVEKRRTTRLKSKAFEKDYRKTVSQSSMIQENEVYSVGQNNISSFENEDASNNCQIGGKTGLKPKYSDGVKAMKKIERVNSTSGKCRPTKGKYFTWYDPSLLRAEKFTMCSVLQLVYIALRLAGCKVLVSDVIRLHREGTFRVSSLEQLLPNDWGKLKNKHFETFLRIDKELSVQSYTNTFATLSNYIGVDSTVLYPSFSDFLPKFIDDWKLPCELEYFILSVNKLIPVELWIRGEKHSRIAKLFPEIYIFSIICVVLKLVFGLDDETEKHQSRFAGIFNEVMKETVRKHGATLETSQSLEWSTLFVFNDWLRNMHLREKLVREEYVPQLLQNQSKLTTCTTTQSGVKSSIHFEACRSIEALFRRSAEPLCQQSSAYSEAGTSSKPIYNTPVLPMEDIVRTYFSRINSQDSLNVNKFSSLRQDFSKCRIDYVFDPQRYIKIVGKIGYTVETLAGDIKNCGQDTSKFSKTHIPLFQPYKRFKCPQKTKINDLSDGLRFLLEEFSEFTFVGFSKVEVLQTLLSVMYDLEDTISRRSLLDLIPVVP